MLPGNSWKCCYSSWKIPGKWSKKNIPKQFFPVFGCYESAFSANERKNMSSVLFCFV